MGVIFLFDLHCVNFESKLGDSSLRRLCSFDELKACVVWGSCDSYVRMRFDIVEVPEEQRFSSVVVFDIFVFDDDLFVYNF